MSTSCWAGVQSSQELKVNPAEQVSADVSNRFVAATELCEGHVFGLVRGLRNCKSMQAHPIKKLETNIPGIAGKFR